jgi:hypothetical protein
LGVGWLAALALGGATIVFEQEVHVTSPVVTLDDVADLSVLPDALRSRAREIEIAAFPRARDRLALSVRRLGERARAQLPALAAWLPQDDRTTVIVERTPTPLQARAPQAPARSCARLAATVEAGAAPLASDFAAAPCDEPAVDHGLRYDTTARVLRATERLDAGALVEAPPLNLLAGVGSGEALSLAIRVGPVVIERDATVARPARPGERLFVRTSDSQVFAVPYPERAP